MSAGALKEEKSRVVGVSGCQRMLYAKTKDHKGVDTLFFNDSMTPSVLNPGGVAEVKLILQPNEKAVLRQLSLDFEVIASTSGFSILHQFQFLEYLSLSINGQEISNYTGNQMFLHYQQMLIDRVAKAGYRSVTHDALLECSRGLLSNSFFGGQQQTNKDIAVGQVYTYCAVGVPTTIRLDLFDIWPQLRDFYWNGHKRALHIDEIKIRIAFRAGSGTIKDQYFCYLDSADSYNPGIKFSNLNIRRRMERITDDALTRVPISYWRVPEYYEVIIPNIRMIPSEGSSFTFKLSDYLRGQNRLFTSMFIAYRNAGYQWTNYLFPWSSNSAEFRTTIQKIGSLDPPLVYAAGGATGEVGSQRNSFDLYEYITTQFRNHYGITMGNRLLDNRGSDTNVPRGLVPIKMLHRFGAKNEVDCKVDSGINPAVDDYQFTLEPMFFSAANTELRLYFTYERQWSLADCTPKEFIIQP